MAAIDKDHIARDVYRAFYTLVTGSITDTQTTPRAVSSWCFSSFPDKNKLDKDDFPIVIFDKPTFTTENWTITKNNANTSMVITVYMAGNKAAENCDNMADQVFHIISDAKYSSLRNSTGLYNIEVVRMDADVVMIGEIKIHTKIIEISGVYRYS